MGKIGIIKAKVEAAGKDILEIEGQIGDYIGETSPRILITKVRCVEGMMFHYNEIERPLLSEFSEKLYLFQREISTDKSSAYFDSKSSANINMRQEKVIVD